VLEPAGWRQGQRGPGEGCRQDGRARRESMRTAGVGFVGCGGDASWQWSEERGRSLRFEAAESREEDFVLS
jgi:hypothetical protein